MHSENKVLDNEPTPRSLIKHSIECPGAVEDVARRLARAVDTAPPDQEVLTLLEHVLAAVKCDVYFALELGVLGGWISVASLLATPDNGFDDTFEELLQEIVGTIVGYGYPSFPRVPLECVDSEYLKPLLYRFKTPSNEDEFLVVLRRVPRNLFGGQGNVGFVLWPAALIQGRWLCRHAREFLHHEDRVLEIGAGVGLSGIVASHFCKHVVLSDFNEECLKNLKFNALLNKGSEAINSLPASTMEHSIVSVAKLDWDKLDGLDGNEDSALSVSQSFERIIGSDIICCKEDVTGVVGVINAYLAKTVSARCFFVVASSDHRWGVETFVPALQGAGMEVHWRPLRHSTYKDDVFKARDRHTESRQAWCEDHHATQVSDDELLNGIECIDYYTWLIVHCRWAN